MTDINNMQDVLDSRDIIERIEELENEAIDSRDSWSIEKDDELMILKELAKEGENSPDWSHGETLIRDSYFQEYAQELADSLGAFDSSATWPNNCIDWEQAAHELQHDYFNIDFDGIDYWIRA